LSSVNTKDSSGGASLPSKGYKNSENAAKREKKDNGITIQGGPLINKDLKKLLLNNDTSAKNNRRLPSNAVGEQTPANRNQTNEYTPIKDEHESAVTVNTKQEVNPASLPKISSKA